MNINFTLVMQAVAFAAFIWFTAKFVWPPLMRAIETRQKQIADGLAAGEQGRQSLATAEKRIADMLAEAKTRSSEIIAQGEKLKTRDDRRGQGARRRPKPTASSPPRRPRSSRKSSRAKEALRNQVADLAVAGAAKILKREVDAKAHADLLASIRQQL